MQARLFEMSGEEFDTGVAEIDAVEVNAHATQFKLGVITGTFIEGETVLQTLQASPLITIKAEASYVKADTMDMRVIDIETNDGLFHSFITGATGLNLITGSVSGATANITEVFNIGTSSVDGTFPNTVDAQNFTFEKEGDAIIDFSESNPFSEGSV
jgi:hypothetical protein